MSRMIVERRRFVLATAERGNGQRNVDPATVLRLPHCLKTLDRLILFSRSSSSVTSSGRSDGNSMEMGWPIASSAV